MKFAAIELTPKTTSDVPETILGFLRDDGTVSFGIKVPGLASILANPGDGTATVIKGLDAVPPENRPTTREANVVHLAWDVMLGLATMLFLLSAWFGLTWFRRRDLPRGRLFLLLASVAGVAGVGAMEAGWVVTEVGRQPWIVVDYLRVEDAATTNSGIWVMFFVILALYLAVGTALVAVLRVMSRRWREQGDALEAGGPYAPSELVDA